MKKGRKSVILTAALSIMLCVSVVVGATFALFATKDEVNIAVSSANVNVTATLGNLAVYSPTKIDIETGTITDPANIATTDGNKGTFAALGTAAINGNKLTLDRMAAGDKVTFEITVKNNSNIKTQYRTRMITGEDDGLFDELDVKIGSFTGRGITDWKSLEAASAEGEAVEVLDCEITIPADSTVMGGSCTISFVVEAVQFNADAKNDIKYYSLSEFNALTEIPEEVKTVYLSIGTLSLKNGSVTIGNDNIRDKYERNSTTEEPFGVSYTDKAGFDLIIDGGTIKDGPDVDNTASSKIAFRIPNKCTVTFKDVKIEGFFGVTGATTDNPYGSNMTHKIAGVTFDGCTFDALWLQNGSFSIAQLTIKNSTFNKHENSVYASNTNPLWFKSIGQNGGMNVNIDNCVFNTNRPVKVVEQDLSGQNVSITNCTFNMESDVENKNAAIMFSTTSTGSELGNVVISGNKVNGGVALLTFYNPSQITMTEGATFTVKGNELNGAKLSVVWKSETEYKPDFVVVE